MLYYKKSFDLIKDINNQKTYENIIQRVADILGLTPQLIAGAIIEEADSKNHNSVIHNWADNSMDENTLKSTEQDLRNDYKVVIDKGIINNKNNVNTFMHITMRDVEPAILVKV